MISRKKTISRKMISRQHFLRPRGDGAVGHPRGELDDVCGSLLACTRAWNETILHRVAISDNVALPDVIGCMKMSVRTDIRSDEAVPSSSHEPLASR